MKHIVRVAIVLLLQYLEVVFLKDSCFNCKNETNKILPRSKEYKRFGEIIDIDGDRIIFGNYLKYQAFIFKKEKTGWRQEAKLNASDGGRSYFGISVGIEGIHAVVGAMYDTIDRKQASGSAYIFQNVNSTWIKQVKIVPTDPSYFHYFGYSVAIYGIYVVVGCPYHSHHGVKSGAIYIFRNIDNVWKEHSKLFPSDGAPYNIFGNIVAMDGRYIVVGTLHNNGNKGALSGAVYIFKNTGNTWTQQIKLHTQSKISDDDDEFGKSIAIKDDYIIVGCPGDHANGLSSGAAYMYKKYKNTWVNYVMLLPVDGVSNDYFGSAVDITKGFAVVGSRRGHHKGHQPGTAYIFKNIGNKWIQHAKLIPSEEADGNFGFAAAISKDYTVVGCPWCDWRERTHHGSAFVFDNVDN